MPLTQFSTLALISGVLQQSPLLSPEGRRFGSETSERISQSEGATSSDKIGESQLDSR
ncbi:hypothetical protein BFJ66_g17981 [Fusarium oxysporum f. sp. cepae]|uniref:Uncharacterized protein n=1 Tax=Fusarium oxysporum f. sp. cepae TaxID=396571 RepID=A0A3L6MQV7_FUSOX|nr:hypothetical protein BFJ65_g18642 [Fusarium oxysporum f. sp. cepae]RKK15621.1 hypothetical protein BFJ67_g17854 [Fusarium oxysporum f. sp. cepae]RKK17239.1 hypothetical protein BFJ66_g17981 [Fusarium oxysporum f. sp. cepae]